MLPYGETMPTSHHRQISTIVEAIIFLNPQSVLDIGVGFGKYGVLCREYLELWDGREDYHTFTRQIDGIEAFEDYLTPVHHHIYDHIFIGKAQQIVKTLKTSYDLVLVIDVLEHLTRTEGTTIIKTLLSKHAGVLISTPKKMESQDDVFQNEYEIHRTQWTRRDLCAFGPSVLFSDQESHLIYLGTRRSVISLLMKQRFEKLKRLGRHIPWARAIYRALKK